MKWATAALCMLLCLVSHAALAQMDEDLIPSSRDFVSPEHFALELRVGPYSPNAPGFSDFFDDTGPLLELEFDYFPLRIPNVVYVGVGGALGTADYKAGALASDGSRASEESKFSVMPISAMAVARLDVLPRKLSVPFIFTGKLGYTFAQWSTSTGGVQDAKGWSQGLRWGAQLGLDLDTFEPAAARAMDEEWGINHSFAFFELWGFVPSGSSLEIGDTSWVAGLGFVF